jgi:hypothetical protein
MLFFSYFAESLTILFLEKINSINRVSEISIQNLTAYLPMYSRTRIAKKAMTTFLTKFFYAFIFYGLSIFNLFTASYYSRTFLTVLLPLKQCSAWLSSIPGENNFFLGIL